MRDRCSLVLVAVLTALVLAVYGQVYRFGFVNLDDDAYVSNNPVVRSGLTLDGVWWAFTTGQEGHWSPLTWLSLMLDVQLFGVSPGAHHLVNVALHLVNTLLLFAVLQRLTRMVWPSWIVAALFALHPLHVESVAWISERKDVLSTLFWFLTLGAYARYVECGARRWYAAMVGLFAAGLMAKSMLVTLPFVLLLLDFWPLGRLTFPTAEPTAPRKRDGKRPADRRRPPLAPLLIEKAPLVALTVVFSVVAYGTQLRGHAIVAAERLPLSLRTANAAVSYVRYLIKAVWPVNLAVFYPYDRNLPVWQPIAASLCLFVVSVLVWRGARRHPYALVGWLWYLGTLVPVIGFVQIGGQALADRYTYVPLVGIFIMAAWGGHALTARWALPSPAIAVGVAALISACALQARSQVAVWSTSESLLLHAAALTTGNAVVHNNLGVTLAAQGDEDAALEQFRTAVRIAPHYADAYNNIGAILGRQGQREEAAAQYRMALRYKPQSADAQRNLALTLLELGQVQEAIQEFFETVRLEPDSAPVRYHLGRALVQVGRAEDAIAQLQHAIHLKPDYAEAYNDLGVALMQLSRRSEAIAQFERALELKPDLPDAIINLDIARRQRAGAAEAEAPEKR